MDSQTLKEFKTRLAQTISWCAPRANLSDPALSLRTPELRPSLLLESRRYTVDSVANARELYGGSEVRNAALPDNFAGGRLLIYFPNFDLACGAAELESHGFFDIHNVPPWDTWVAYIHDPENVDYYDTEYLIAWVPPAFVALVNDGVDVNPEQCIQWLDETPLEIAAALNTERHGRTDWNRKC